MASIPEVTAGLLGCVGPAEEEEQEVVDSGHGSGRDLEHRRVEGRIAAARAGADEHEFAYEFGVPAGEVLGDEAAQRESEHVGMGDAERHNHLGDVVGHVGHEVAWRSRRRRNASSVDEDHLATRGESVGEHRVPVIHAASEVLDQHDRHVGSGTPPAVGEPIAVDLDVLGGCSGVCDVHGGAFWMGMRGDVDGRGVRRARQRVRNSTTRGANCWWYWKIPPWPESG